MVTYGEFAGFVRRVLRRSVRFDVMRFDHTTHPVARRMRLMQHAGVDLVLDIGANEGQYARELRQLGYTGRIVSFEPLSSAFAGLDRARAGDPLWSAHRLALGERAGRATMHIAGNSASSSLLDMLPAHEKSAPESRYTATEEVPIETLDAAAARELRQGERVLVKIDAQGYELKILESGAATLERAVGAQLELSLVPLYDGAPLLAEMLAFMEERGFRLMSVEPGHCDPDTGQLLQMDGLFFRP